MPEKDPFLLLRSNLKRHTAEKPTRVVDPPSALRFCAALAVCAARPLTTTHGQGPVLRMYYPAIWRVESGCGLPAVNHELVQQLLLLASIKI